MSAVIRLTALAAVMALAFAAFVWPSARLEPRGVPIGVVAPVTAEGAAPGGAGSGGAAGDVASGGAAAGAASEGSASGGSAAGGVAAGPASGRTASGGSAAGGAAAATPLADSAAFDVHRYATAEDARAAIRDREVYGAVDGSTLYVATGASAAVASALREMAPDGAKVVDLAPGTQHDPRGATLGSLALPLTLFGLGTALLAHFTVKRARERVALIAGGSVIAGVVAALLVQTWLDALPGSWLGLAGAVALTVAAVAAAVAGLGSLLGHPGIGLGAALMMLVANPWSGLSSAPEILPEPVGTIGQWLPTGAAGDLLRGVVFFDAAATGAPLGILAAWALGGLALIAAAALRSSRRPATAPHGAAATAY